MNSRVNGVGLELLQVGRLSTNEKGIINKFGSCLWIVISNGSNV